MKKVYTDTRSRLIKIMEFYKLSKKDFAAYFGMSEQTIRNYIGEKESRHPHFIMVHEIQQNFPEINIRWFIDGTGDMFEKGEQYPDIATDDLTENTVPYHPIHPPKISPVSTIRKRIKNIMELRHYDFERLSKETGIQATTFKAQLEGSGKLTVEVIQALCNLFPSISYNWFLTGDPDTYNESKWIEFTFQELHVANNEKGNLREEIGRLKGKIEELEKKIQERD